MSADLAEPGDEVLVDVSMYVHPPRDAPIEPMWCRVVSTNRWSASSYPVKVAIPGAGIGQYADREIQGVRNDRDA